MAIEYEQIVELIKRPDITTEDVAEFLRDPWQWREETAKALLSPDAAQTFWQGVYDDLGVRVTVPAVPKLTDKQVKSLDKFGFLPVYVPAITENDYPKDFMKPACSRFLAVSSIERIPFEGLWVAVETIAKPNWDDKNYPDDRLMAAVKRATRFNTSHNDLTGGLLAEIAEKMHFPKKRIRLPSAEEWNLIGNNFNWLCGHRDMPLPDLGSTRSSEWCENAYGMNRLVVGDSGNGGLADVGIGGLDDRDGCFGFRVVIDL